MHRHSESPDESAESSSSPASSAAAAMQNEVQELRGRGLRPGVTCDLNQDGKPIAYHGNGFSFEYHENDNSWYYHQDSGGEYVKVEAPTVQQDCSVSAKENGGLNSGRQHTLTGDGQSTGPIKPGNVMAAVSPFANGLKWVDNTLGTNLYSPAKAFYDSYGESLVDGALNDIVYLSAFSLAQNGLEKLGLIPQQKKLDQLIPDLDLYDGIDAALSSKP